MDLLQLKKPTAEIAESSSETFHVLTSPVAIFVIQILQAYNVMADKEVCMLHILMGDEWGNIFRWSPLLAGDLVGWSDLNTYDQAPKSCLFSHHLII